MNLTLAAGSVWSYVVHEPLEKSPSLPANPATPSGRMALVIFAARENSVRDLRFSPKNPPAPKEVYLPY